VIEPILETTHKRTKVEEEKKENQNECKDALFPATTLHTI